MAKHLFGYLKKFPDKWITIDSSKHRPMGELSGVGEPGEDWSELYPYAKETINWDPRHPKPLGKPLDSIVYFDSNFAHDEVTRKSISGTIGFVGNTPVSWSSRRQGAVATSTYSAELCAAKAGVEEAINIWYMLRSLGVRLSGATRVVGDNLGALQSVSKPGTPCKKKTSMVSYHFVRETHASGEVAMRKIHTDFNLADPFTKALDKGVFWRHFRKVY